jgi:hypothetical protein
MKTFLTTAAIVATLTMPAFAEGQTAGSEAAGEANGSTKLSTQPQPPLAAGQQKILPRTGASASGGATTSGMGNVGSSGSSDSGASTGADSAGGGGSDSGNR